VAAFDFDGTLTYSDSLSPFLRALAGSLRFGAGTIRLAPAMGRFLRSGCRDRQGAKEAVLGRFLSGVPCARAQAAAELYAAGTVDRLLNPHALRALRRHQAQGHRVVIISSCLELYLLPLGERLGVDGVLGTRLEEKEGRLTGRIAGADCIGEEKAVRLRAWLTQHGGHLLAAYGDSAGDRQLLAMADEPSFRPFRGRWFRPAGLARWLWALVG
jgi:phosphatidylglycerophosphatase C